MRSNKSQARRERSDMSSGKSLKIRRIYIVHDGDRIVMAGNVVARNANRPLVFVKMESFFHSEVKAEICWISKSICAAHQLLLVIHDAVREARVVFHEITTQQLPYRQRRPPPRN